MKRVVIVILLFVILSYGIYSYSGYIFPRKYNDIVTACADKYNLDKDIIYAIIKAESNFDKDATSHKNAVGLMQITEETGRWCAEKNNIENYSDEMLKSPEYNIMFGAWYLRYLIDELEDEDCAVMAYNAGINNVKKWIDKGYITVGENSYEDVPYNETKIYIQKVKFYKKIYGFLYRD